MRAGLFWPHPAMSAVRPSCLAVLTSAPTLISADTMGMEPFSAAAISAVLPPGRKAFGSAPACSSENESVTHTWSSYHSLQTRRYLVLSPPIALISSFPPTSRLLDFILIQRVWREIGYDPVQEGVTRFRCVTSL